MLVFLCHDDGGWYENSAEVVVYSVGVGIWGEQGCFENCEIFKPLYRQEGDQGGLRKLAHWVQI